MRTTLVDGTNVRIEFRHLFPESSRGNVVIDGTPLFKLSKGRLASRAVECRIIAGEDENERTLGEGHSFYSVDETAPFLKEDGRVKALKRAVEAAFPFWESCRKGDAVRTNAGRVISAYYNRRAMRVQSTPSTPVATDEVLAMAAAEAMFRGGAARH